MQITVFGAAGKVGQQVVRLLQADGYAVAVFVHTNNPFTDAPGLQVIQGSVTDLTAVSKAIAGSDAVISALGSWGTAHKDVVSTGTDIIIQAMKAANVNRLVAVTGGGAWCSSDRPKFVDKGNHTLLKLVAPRILLDGEKHLLSLEASSLDWTSVRSPVMTNSKSEQYTLRSRLPHLTATIPRAAVARCLVDQLLIKENIRKAPVITNV